HRNAEGALRILGQIARVLTRLGERDVRRVLPEDVAHRGHARPVEPLHPREELADPRLLRRQVGAIFVGHLHQEPRPGGDRLHPAVRRPRHVRPDRALERRAPFVLTFLRTEEHAPASTPSTLPPRRFLYAGAGDSYSTHSERDPPGKSSMRPLPVLS